LELLKGGNLFFKLLLTVEVIGSCGTFCLAGCIDHSVRTAA